MLYALGRVYDEAEMVVIRSNRRAATDAILVQAAAGSIMSKEMGKVFKGLIADLTGEK